MKLTKKGILIISVLVLMICVAVSAFLLLPDLLKLIGSSFRNNNDIDLPATPQVAAPATAQPFAPVPPPSPTPVPPDISAYRPYLINEEYITIDLKSYDIHSGSLLLVNTEHRYEIPGDHDLVFIADERTAKYTIRSFSFRFHRIAMTALNELMQGFIDDTGREFMYIISAYRDYNAQQRELNDAIYLHGREAAMMLSKEPGHSEHHTGLAVDLAILIDGERYAFDFYDSTKWFARNAYKYGFVLRYPGNKVSVTKTIYEPWHFRYVSLPHSYIMYDKGWVLEEYIEKIREYTFDEPMKATFNGINYEIFFTNNTIVDVPAYADYEISGNNVDGFIVTISNRYDKLTNIALE